MSFNHKPSNTSVETYSNKETGRSCGSCSMCCYLPSFEVGEWKKPKNQWCQHCSGHSCNIYADRPELCREFECMWLMSNILDDRWYPKNSKIIAVASLTGNGDTSLVFHVHDKYPLRWREEPYYSDIKRLATYGLQANTWITEVVVGDQLWIILPDKDILITSQGFKVIQVAKNEWGVIQRDLDGTESRKPRLAGSQAT